MPKFSIITPVHLGNSARVEDFIRCIRSVENQTFKDFEWVIVDDGSRVDFLWEQLTSNSNLPTVNLIHKDHAERIIAYNRAFEAAQGDWWLFLDSDDELTPNCLEVLNKYINKSRGARKMFNFGVLYKYHDGGNGQREAFRPKWMGKKYGHEIFGGNTIVNGAFVFHRSIYDKMGGFMPDVVTNIDCSDLNYPPYTGAARPYIRDLHANTPYDFSAYWQLKYPEIRQYFMVDHEAEPAGKIIKELGNPWGQDYALFYHFTRKYRSQPLNEYLYVVHPRL